MTVGGGGVGDGGAGGCRWRGRQEEASRPQKSTISQSDGEGKHFLNGEAASRLYTRYMQGKELHWSQKCLPELQNVLYPKVEQSTSTRYLVYNDICVYSICTLKTKVILHYQLYRLYSRQMQQIFDSPARCVSAAIGAALWIHPHTHAPSHTYTPTPIHPHIQSHTHLHTQQHGRSGRFEWCKADFCPRLLPGCRPLPSMSLKCQLSFPPPPNTPLPCSTPLSPPQDINHPVQNILETATLWCWRGGEVSHAEKMAQRGKRRQWQGRRKICVSTAFLKRNFWSN